MLISLFFLTFALSIDAFGIGTSYGIRKIKLTPIATVIISLVSFVFASISVYLGKFISNIFTEDITFFISIFLLITLGLFIIKKGVEKNESENNTNHLQKIYSEKEKNIFCIFIKSLGITINVIKMPSSCDLDHSKKIEAKEALYLGMALSMDCVGVGITLHSYTLLFPICLVAFQLIFFTFGVLLGKKLNKKTLNESKISILSGLILIFIASIKIILK